MIVGHPAPVTCGPPPSTQSGGQFIELGRTTFVNGQPTAITLSGTVCTEWSGLVPWTSFWSEAPDEEAGGALLVAIHEAEHYRYADLNEARTECRALRDYRLVLDQLFPVSRYTRHGRALRTALVTGAYRLDASMPAEYHGARC
jgi:hypothetical protein